MLGAPGQPSPCPASVFTQISACAWAALRAQLRVADPLLHQFHRYPFDLRHVVVLN
jgi:hypothetical protein